MTVVNVTPPVITGLAQVGQLLHSSNGTWTHDDPLEFDYQWERCDSAGASCVDIVGAVFSTYLIQNADIGSRLRVVVTATENPTPPPPLGESNGMSWLRYGNGESPPSHVADYDNVVVSWAGAGAAGSSAATRPLVYMSAVSCKTHAGGAYYFGVSKEEVEANGWRLAASGGGYLYNAGYGGTAVPLGDMGDPDYQDLWCSNVAGILSSFGVDGMFVDDVLPYLGGISGGKTSTKYPTNAAVQAAYASFSEAVHSYFDGIGKYVMLNANGYIPGNSGSDNGDVQLAFWSQLTSHALCAEVWQVRNDTGRRHQGAGFQNNWDGWQRLPAQCQSNGVDFIAISATSASGDADYSIASMLMETSHGSIIWSPYPYNNYNINTIWHSFYDTCLTLGDPVSAKVHNGSRWERQYDGGLVWVNPVNATYGVE